MVNNWGEDMLSIRAGRVDRVLSARPGLTEVLVEVDGRLEKAINYDYLTGSVSPGDKVQLNVTAVQLGLGTGGWHFVMANTSNTGMDDRQAGHLMKLRYTPVQVKVLGVEEETSPYRGVIEQCSSLVGTPVVVGSLHSMLPPTAAGAKQAGGRRLRVAYVMTDGAALPMVFSRLVPELKEKGLIDGTVTVGHAFGGDLEAVNIYTGLLAAKEVLQADVILVAMGPGIVGTGTTWGFSGVEQGAILNAVHVLGGEPVAVPRISFADPRPRHRGLSHHTVTVLGRATLVPVIVPLPVMGGEKRRHVLEQIRREGLEGRHRFLEQDGTPALTYLDHLGVRVTSMGRSPQEDAEFFLAAGAAGHVAAGLIQSSVVGRQSSEKNGHGFLGDHFTPRGWQSPENRI